MVESRTLLRKERLLQRQLQEAKDVLDSVKGVFYLTNGKSKRRFYFIHIWCSGVCKDMARILCQLPLQKCACKLFIVKLLDYMAPYAPLATRRRCGATRGFGDVVVRIPPGHIFSMDTSFQAAKSVGVCALERRCWSRCRVSLRLKVWLHCAASLCVSELGTARG